MPASLRILVLALVGVFLLSGVALLVLIRHPPSGAVVGGGPSVNPGAPDESVVTLSLPPFTLTTQDGAPLTRDTLNNQVTVVDFMFTHCPFICPTLTQKMREIARRLTDTDVRFLSISVDPAHDTPAALRTYAERHNADLHRWTFAAGDAATIGAIVRDGLKFALYDQPESPVKLDDGSTMPNVVHPPFFVLVGPDAKVLGLYPVASIPESADQLVERARAVDRAIDRSVKRPPSGPPRP